MGRLCLKLGGKKADIVERLRDHEMEFFQCQCVERVRVEKEKALI